MGACGCCEGNQLATLPGPNGGTYLISLNPPCSYCGVGISVGVDLYSASAGDEESDDYAPEMADVPTLELHGDGRFGPQSGGFSVVGTSELMRALRPYIPDHALYGPEDMNDPDRAPVDIAWDVFVEEIEFRPLTDAMYETRKGQV